MTSVAPGRSPYQGCRRSVTLADLRRYPNEQGLDEDVELPGRTCSSPELVLRRAESDLAPGLHEGSGSLGLLVRGRGQVLMARGAETLLGTGQPAPSDRRLPRALQGEQGDDSAWVLQGHAAWHWVEAVLWSGWGVAPEAGGGAFLPRHPILPPHLPNRHAGSHPQRQGGGFRVGDVHARPAWPGGEFHRAPR